MSVLVNNLLRQKWLMQLSYVAQVGIDISSALLKQATSSSISEKISFSYCTGQHVCFERKKIKTKQNRTCATGHTDNYCERSYARAVRDQDVTKTSKY